MCIRDSINMEFSIKNQKGLAGFKVREFKAVQNDFSKINQSEFAHVLQFDKNEIEEEPFSLDEVLTVESCYEEDIKESREFLNNVNTATKSTASKDSLYESEVYNLNPEWDSLHRNVLRKFAPVCA
eukprot:TRINITY_DN5279_c0_g1_i4.p1 TRINITY_DN5279_c0_g1~~TRINITY_DN5279_c0_g1_i4.p1  ORF type:complete len:126 (+),score=27.68 TRINITY_DN5279_c0_g1_i4:65-442(+)